MEVKTGQPGNPKVSEAATVPSAEGEREDSIMRV